MLDYVSELSTKSPGKPKNDEINVNLIVNPYVNWLLSLLVVGCN